MFDEYIDLINSTNITQSNDSYENLEENNNYNNIIIDAAIILSSSLLLGGVIYYIHSNFCNLNSNYVPIPDIEMAFDPVNSVVVNGFVFTQR